MFTLNLNCRILMIMLITGIFSLNNALGQVSEFNDANCGGTADASADCSAAIGDNATVTSSAVESIAIGSDANADGATSIAVGVAAESDGENSYTFGNRAKANGDNSMAIGRNVISASSADYNYVFGMGYGTGLENDISNSIMIGVNSTEPTMFIEDAGGGSALGRVGIGTTEPDGMLHIQDESNANTELIIERGAANSGIIRFHQTGASTGYVRQYSTGLMEIANEGSSANLRMNVNVGGTPTTVLTLAGANGNFGVNTPTPGAPMDVRSTTGGNEEVIARFRVSDSSDEFFRIQNRSNDAGEFAAWLEGSSDVADNNSLELTGRVLANANTGAVPVVQFSALHATSTTEIVRPLFQWSSNLENFMILDEEGNLGIGTTAPNWLLTVNGDAARPGGGMWINSSDENLKQDIEPFEDGLETLLQISPKSYRYNGMFGLPSDKTYVGIIAQEMQQVAPYMISTSTLIDPNTGDTGEFLTYDGTALTYVIVNSIKELEQRIVAQDSLIQLINNLGNELSLMQQQLNQCCSSEQVNKAASDDGNSQLLKANQKNSEYVLFNTNPNPFAEQTMISYHIPESVRTAEVIVTDQIGNIVKTIVINNRGLGTTKLTGSGLISGAYTCVLLLDGKSSAHKIVVKR